ncbi:MAG: substrate-binding periplasmic protein [Candidatus Rifleibacteriota bacterium]
MKILNDFKASFYLTALIMMIVSAAPISAEIPQIKALKELGVLRIAINSKDTPPFYYQDADQKLQGTEIELINEICEALEVKPELVRKTASFDGLVDLVAADEADICISWLSITAKRSEKVYFSQPYMRLKAGVLVNFQAAIKSGWKENEETFFNFLQRTGGENVSILSESGSWHSHYVAEAFPKARLISEEKWEEKIPDLFSGNITCILYDGFILQGIIRNHPELHVKVKFENNPAYEDLIGIAVNPKLAQLVPWLNSFLELNRHKYYVDDSATLLDKLDKKENDKSQTDSFASQSLNAEARKLLLAMVASGCLILFTLTFLKLKRYAGKLRPERNSGN